jgi:hypothetical protein
LSEFLESSMVKSISLLQIGSALTVGIAACLGATLPATAQAPTTNTPPAAPTPASPPATPPTTPAAPPAQGEQFTLCTYDTGLDIPNPLGMRAFITIREVDGNSIFVYNQFPSIVASSRPTPPADISSERTLTLYETPLAEARQLLIDDPTYYAALLGTENAESLSGENGFKPVNDTLTCQAVSGENPPNSATPPGDPENEPAPPTASRPTIADLPNGNYRMTSAEYPLRVVSDEELLENGGIVFTFRKFGDTVTGNFGYIDSEVGACVSGTVAGNVVTGVAFTNDQPTTIDGKTYLGPDTALALGANAGGDGEAFQGNRYNNSTVDLSDFSRINAGTVLPPESCS